jgi:nucleotide-binding universal stress UspA family protein
MLLGSLTTTVLHEAACSVLVAREPASAAVFPSAIVAGCDGSPASEHAVSVAEELASRFGAPLRLVVATGGKGLDPVAVAAAHPAVERHLSKPVDTLVTASEQADLVVVGSRGLHGVRALGSVSERVAHQARCSVLVVR